MNYHKDRWNQVFQSEINIISIKREYILTFLIIMRVYIIIYLFNLIIIYFFVEL